MSLVFYPIPLVGVLRLRNLRISGPPLILRFPINDSRFTALALPASCSLCFSPNKGPPLRYSAPPAVEEMGLPVLNQGELGYCAPCGGRYGFCIGTRFLVASTPQKRRDLVLGMTNPLLPSALLCVLCGAKILFLTFLMPVACRLPPRSFPSLLHIFKDLPGHQHFCYNVVTFAMR